MGLSCIAHENYTGCSSCGFSAEGWPPSPYTVWSKGINIDSTLVQCKTSFQQTEGTLKEVPKQRSRGMGMVWGVGQAIRYDVTRLHLYLHINRIVA